MLVGILLACVILVFVAAIVTFVYVYTKYLKNNSLKSGGAVTSVNTPKVSSEMDAQEDFSTDAKSFLPFDSIEDYAINLGTYQYRAIIECSSISYSLRTPQEREMIEYGFQAFLNSITYPIVLYVQTRAVDNSKILKQMEIKAKKAVEETPEINDYVSQYMTEMYDLPYTTGFPKCKKKFIIIPFEPNTDLSELSESEQDAFCLDELYNRAAACCYELQGIGLQAHVLNRVEIANVIYASFHRNEFLLAESIIRGELNTLSIRGISMDREYSSLGKLQTMLNETKNRIHNQLQVKAEDKEEIMIYKKLYEAFEVLENEANNGWKDLEQLLEVVRQKANELEKRRVGEYGEEE